jgi:hypothetical protein
MFPRDANASMDASMLGGGGGGDINTTARLDTRKSLSSSQIGRGSFVRGGGGGGGPASAKKSMFGAGRPSIALQGGDKCVRVLREVLWGEAPCWRAAGGAAAAGGRRERPRPLANRPLTRPHFPSRPFLTLPPSTHPPPPPPSLPAPILSGA